MNQRDAIKALLTANAGWNALVTGGTYLFDDLDPRLGLTIQTAQYDSLGQLLPTVVLSFNASNPTQLWTSERRFFQLTCYDHSGYDRIEQMHRAAKDLLHRKQAVSDDEGLNFIVWAGGGAHYTEDHLKGAPAAFVRYAIEFTRK